MIGVSPLGTVPLSSVGSLAEPGALFGASASLSAAGRRVRIISASFTGAGGLSGAGIRQRLGRAALLASGSLSALPLVIYGGSVAFAGSANLYGRLTVIIFGSATFLGQASLYSDVNLRIYASTHEFITRPTDYPANRPIPGTLQKIMRFDRSILNGGRIGQVTAGWGEIELINAEGDYDELIEKYAVDGRQITLKVGLQGAPYGLFQTLFDGTAADWHVEEDVLRVQVRDNTFKLEVPAQALIYAGTGDLEGTEDLKSKRKPLALGELGNATPVDLIPTELVRQISSGPVHAITAVYDNAVALTPTVNYPDAVTMRAATTGLAGSGADIEAGEYATCLALGLIRLGGQPQGVVTCDVQGDKTSGVYVNTTAGVIRRLINISTQVTDPGGIIADTFNQVDVLQPAVIGYYLESEESVADVVANLMGAVGGWGGMRRNGRFELGIFTPPSGTASGFYDRTSIISIERQKLPDGLSPPPWRFRMAWGRNWTVQTDVEGQSGVSAERVAFLRESRRLVTSDEATGKRVKLNHPLAQDPEPIESYFRDEADAQLEADRQLDMFGPTSSLYKISLKIRPFTHEIGQVIYVEYPRWDLVAGRLLRIVSLGDDADAGIVELIGFG